MTSFQFLARERLARAGTFAVAAVALLLLACAPEATKDESPVVAKVDGRPITRNQLDDYIRDRLFEEQVGSRPEAQQYEARSSALSEMLSERVLDDAAAAKHMTPDELVDKTVADLGPVTDEEVAAFFEEHRDRFRPPNNTLEQRAGQIKRYLESQRRQQALDSIRQTANVEVLLEAPRLDVAATGPSIGPENAPVTIVEFSDFQCPFCNRVEPTIRRLVERYGDQIRVVYRHFPLDRIHPRARPAAEASVCAEEQDRFWAYHEKLFANQHQLSDEDLKRYATELGLDADAFSACLTRSDVKARVQADLDAGEKAGVSGTPAFFVNGIMVSGARSEQAFAEIIDSELAAAKSGTS